MSLSTPPVEHDSNLGPVSNMNWGEDAAAGGQYMITMDEERSIDHYYYRDAQGKLQLQPAYQQQISRAEINWRGVAADLATIIFGAIGGAGESVLTAIGVTGGAAANQARQLDDYRKKKKG